MADTAAQLEEFYDEWQLAVVRLDPAERCRVLAGPGTGKTTTLAGKVAWMADVLGMEPESLLVLSFTRKAVAEIRGKVAGLTDVETAKAINDRVRTFDSWCTKLLEGPMGMTKEQLRGMRYASRIEEVIQRLIDDASPLAGLRHVVVDEYQDLVGVRADLVLQLVDSLPGGCGVTLLGDPCQAIYDYQVRGTGERDYAGFRLANQRQPGFSDLELRTVYRTRGADQPAWLVEDLAALRGAILAGDVNAAGAAASLAAEDVLANACEITRPSDVKARARDEVDGPGGRMARRVGIIARTNKEAEEAYEDVLLARPQSVHVELAKDEPYSRSDSGGDGGEGPGVYVYTVHSSKGREFDEVWLWRGSLEEMTGCCGLPRFEQAEEARVAYVALTRTKGDVLVLGYGNPEGD